MKAMGISPAGAGQETAAGLLEAIETNPRDPLLHRRLGLHLWREKKLIEALIEFRKILVITPDNLEARFALAGIEAERRHDRKVWEILFELTFRAEKISGRSSPFDLNRLRRRWKDFPAPFDGANGSIWIELFEGAAQAVRRDAKYLEQSVKAGRISLEERCYDKALWIFTRLVVMEPRTTEYRLLRAAALTARRRDAEAETEYSEAILLEPRNPRVYKELALVKARRGAAQEARAAFEQVLKLDPADQEARSWLARSA